MWLMPMWYGGCEMEILQEIVVLGGITYALVCAIFILAEIISKWR